IARQGNRNGAEARVGRRCGHCRASGRARAADYRGGVHCQIEKGRRCGWRDEGTDGHRRRPAPAAAAGGGPPGPPGPPPVRSPPGRVICATLTRGAVGPAGTGAVGGTIAAGLSLVSDTTAPPLGATPFRITVAIEGLP